MATIPMHIPINMKWIKGKIDGWINVDRDGGEIELRGNGGGQEAASKI